MASQLVRLLSELRRRKVWRVCAAYSATALATALAVAELYDDVGLPEGTPRLVIAVLAVGFPLALILAWVYELRPESRESAAPLRPQVAATDDRESIVVLPFDNMSPDPADAYFSDGLTEEIITQLANLRSLRVISRNSAMVLKDTQKDTRTIGRELGVGYVLEGSVRKAGQSLRVTAQLIDAQADEHVWAETYARELKDVFEIQSELALNVAGALRASLDPHAVERIKQHPTDSLDAREAYLLGRHHWFRITEEGMWKAKAYFERALELDPHYAGAHALLGWWYAWSGGAVFPLIPIAEAIRKARASAEQAIELDPYMGDAYSALTYVEASYGWAWEKAHDNAKLGVERDPNCYTAWNTYAWLLTILGQHEDCLAATHRFAELDPLSELTPINVAIHYCRAGRTDEALEHARRYEQIDSPVLEAWTGAYVLLCRGDYEEALKHLSRFQGHWEAMRQMWGAWILPYAFARAGRLTEFRESVAHLEGRAVAGAATWVDVALAHMGVPDHERALHFLEKVPGQRPPPGDGPARMGAEPLFSPIREDPRFQEVLRRVGLAQVMSS